MIITGEGVSERILNIGQYLWLKRALFWLRGVYINQTNRMNSRKTVSWWQHHKHCTSYYYYYYYFAIALLCLQPSSLQGLATLWTSCLHLPLSSVFKSILSSEYPVYWRMLSIHVVFGLPLLRHPGVVPCIICFSRLSALCLIICPKYDNFLAFTDNSKRFFATSTFSSTQSFVHFAVHDTRSFWLSPFAIRIAITLYSILVYSYLKAYTLSTGAHKGLYMLALRRIHQQCAFSPVLSINNIEFVTLQRRATISSTFYLILSIMPIYSN